MMRWVLGLVIALLAQTNAAHEVWHDITTTDAVLVRLTFADGQPLAYEKYELYVGDSAVPMQVGNTDAEGRITFIAQGDQIHRLKAFTADGHGVDLRFMPPNPRSATETPPGLMPRSVLALLGLALILALFGLFQLFIRHRKDP